MEKPIIIILIIYLIALFYTTYIREDMEPNISSMAGNMPIISMDHDFYGPIIIYNNNRDLISNHVKQNLIWEQNIIELMSKYYQDGTDILDVGANMGLNSLGMHKIKPITGTLHCFEPQYHTMSICAYNTSNIPKVNYYQMALSNKFDIMSFESNSDNANVGGMSMKSNLENNNIITSVPLDSMPFKNKISLMKVDVEGMEAEFLEGAKKTILQHKPVIIIEIWQSKLDITPAVLKKIGYKLIHHIGADDYIYAFDG